MDEAGRIDLFGLNQAATETELKAIRKRDLRNLLTSYADEADVFVETIQNAYDAVLVASEAGLYKDETPCIAVIIGRRRDDRHYLLVSDNGIGMSQDTANRFTTPGFTSRKKLGKTLGYKGVGASFFFAASDLISFTTKTDQGSESSATVENAWHWVMGSTEPDPRITSTAQLPENGRKFLPNTHGTVICYYFHDGIRPRNLSSLVNKGKSTSEEINNWAHFLGSKTALGRVTGSSINGLKVIIGVDTGDQITSESWNLGEFDKDNKILGYPYPHKILKVEKEISAIDATPRGQQDILHKNKYQALHKCWTKDEILSLTPSIDFTAEEQTMVESSFDFFDLFFAYSTSILDEIHKRTGCRARHIRYGIRIAVDGIPQGRITEFDLTSNQGQGRQAHAVAAFSGLELDTGRKIPADEVVSEVIRKIGVRAMSIMSGYKFALRKKDRPESLLDLAAWRQDVTDRSSSPLGKTLFEKLAKRPPLEVDPGSENDVIALVAGLIAADMLKGYQLAALSGYNQYDGLVHIATNNETVSDLNDPFSARDQTTTREGKYKVLEFKLHFADLFEDFDLRKKNPSDIDLLVCWTLPEISVTRGRLQYTYGDRNDYRQVYGMTHLWEDENSTSSIPIICLKHFLAEKLKYEEHDQPGLGTAIYAAILEQEKTASI